MEEYTFDFGRRMIFKNGAVYLSTDLVGRINIPCAMINPKYKRKKCTVELQDGKVILKYNDNYYINDNNAEAHNYNYNINDNNAEAYNDNYFDFNDNNTET